MREWVIEHADDLARLDAVRDEITTDADHQLLRARHIEVPGYLIAEFGNRPLGIADRRYHSSRSRQSGWWPALTSGMPARLDAACRHGTTEGSAKPDPALYLVTGAAAPS